MDKGAHFHRCDFQVHTPRDANWSGAPAVSDEDRAQWAESLIKACRAKGLDAIAITDHHDVASFPYVRLAASSEIDPEGDSVPEEERIVVFPGLELTLSDPCQALLIFDADLPEEDLGRVSTVLGYTPSPPSESKTAQTESLGLSLKDVAERLNEQSTLKGRYILLPNVTDGGYQTLMRKHFAIKYREMPCVGGYVDGSFADKTSEGNRKILDGQVPHYGNKALAIFQTSDCRAADFSTLGTPSTWVKWSTPTAEALRQSCLARQSRVLLNSPALPAIHITRIEVSASRFLGKQNLFLNQQLNALIGGRGTGKSTLLEYLRWGLCHQFSSRLTGDNAPTFATRHAALIERTLAEVKGVVSVHVAIHGVTHIIRRKSEDASITLKLGDAEFRATTEDEVRRLVPIDAFSQKELSSVGGRPAEMRRFLSRRIEGALEATDTSLRDASDRIRVAYAQLRSNRLLQAEEQAVRGEADSIQRQIESIRKGIPDVAKEDAATLRNADLYKEESRTLSNWREELTEAHSALERVRKVLAGKPSSPIRADEVPDGDALRGMHAELQKQFGALSEAVESWLVSLSAASNEQDVTDGKFAEFLATQREVKARIDRADAAYREATSRMAAHKSSLEQLEDLRSKLVEKENALGELRSRIRELSDVEQTLEEAARDWRAAVEKRSQLLRGEATRLGEQSQALVRAQVGAACGFHEISSKLADAIRGSRVRGERLDALIEEAEQADAPLSAWLDVLAELDLLMLVQGREQAPLPETPRLRAVGLTDANLRAIAEQMSPDTWLGLRVTPPEDLVRFEYRSRENDYIPFQDASAGQRATALLRILLKQQGPPLLIDQPEDDLDNEVIHEVARDLWDAKAGRQLVFASHNANLVVNGDADLVVAFGYSIAGEQSSGDIKAEGAIDDRGVRSQITRVMEGGQEAFELRQAKYGF